MQVFQAVGGGLYLVVGTILGVRLLAQAARERVMPELLLGLAFLLAGTVGAPIEVVGDGMARAGHAGAGPLLAIGKAVTIAGMAAYVGFTWRVFRPTDRWAAAFAGALVLVQGVAFVGFAASGRFGVAANDGVWFWIELSARVVAPVWTIAECIRYRALMLRRVRLGLADPIVADRFLLWAVASGGGLVMLLLSIVPRVLSANHWYIETGMSYPLVALGGIVASIAYWLAFFPPAWYRSRVALRAPA